MKIEDCKPGTMVKDISENRFGSIVAVYTGEVAVQWKDGVRALVDPQYIQKTNNRQQGINKRPKGTKS